jgi:NAD-dependent deacetylase
MQNLDPFKCAEYILNAKSAVALTGAGISTSAGIADFRGPQGLYVTRRYDPEKVFHIGWFRKEPRYFYEFSRDFIESIKYIQPTPTHRFLAMLENTGYLKSIVTQNIDLLHQAAGSKKVIELHGSYRSATCQKCRDRIFDLDAGWWGRKIETSQNSPIVHCDKCNGVLKPDIVFFGEQVTAFSEAEKEVTSTDLLLVLGSSLQVAPASLLPGFASAVTLIINKGPVALESGPNRYFADQELDVFYSQVADILNQ